MTSLENIIRGFEDSRNRNLTDGHFLISEFLQEKDIIGLK